MKLFSFSFNLMGNENTDDGKQWTLSFNSMDQYNEDIQKIDKFIVTVQ